MSRNQLTAWIVALLLAAIGAWVVLNLKNDGL
jgi:hypothetical protein